MMINRRERTRDDLSLYSRNFLNAITDCRTQMGEIPKEDTRDGSRACATGTKRGYGSDEENFQPSKIGNKQYQEES
jgi:hypothetical protein